MQSPDITKLPITITIAIIGATFSVFSLIYNEDYILFGFITFLYGIVSFWIDKLYWDVISSPLKDGEKVNTRNNKKIYYFNSIFMLVWIISLVYIFSK